MRDRKREGLRLLRQTSISQDALAENESRINDSAIGRLASSTSSHLSAKSREGATAEARKHVNAAFPRAFARIPGIWLIGNAKVRDYGVFGRPARIHSPTRDEREPHAYVRRTIESRLFPIHFCKRRKQHAPTHFRRGFGGRKGNKRHT